MEPADWYISPEEYAIAAKNGIKKDTLEHRIRYYGWNKEKAITKKIVRCKLGKWIELAAKNGIPRETFNSRVYNLKWDLEYAATTPVNKKYPEWIKKELKRNGIKYNTFLKRIEKGWDLERAYTEKTWDKLDSLKKGREKQRTLKLGPYKAINSFWKLIKSE